MDPVTGNLIMIIGFVIGSALILLEAFMPGFGVAGITGIILEIVAIVMTASLYGTTWAVIATFAVLLLIGLAILLSYRSAMKGRLSKSPLILKNEESAQPVSDTAALAAWISREGTVATPLRPAGFIEIDGERTRPPPGTSWKGELPSWSPAWKEITWSSAGSKPADILNH